ncbi:MAG: Uma2 family endonuclease [Moorea sp. SIO2B7]|nr:Uma2 family endonuclease [Moorena sp. SIO2B7]
MTAKTITLLTFEQFLQQYPEDRGRYELHQGKIVEMIPIGAHEKVAALIARKLDFEIERLSLPYFIPRSCLVKPKREGEGYLPDIIVLDEKAIEIDPYWQKYSTISLGNSAKLVVEVLSTNWQDYYLTKLAEYEKLGIPEYWIVDYRALGGIRYLGSPKIPTIWIYQLVKDEYGEVKMFRDNDLIQSSSFPGLKLTPQQIFQAEN